MIAKLVTQNTSQANKLDWTKENTKRLEEAEQYFKDYADANEKEIAKQKNAYRELETRFKKLQDNYKDSNL